MAVFTASVWTDILLAIGTVSILAIWYVKWTYKYWDRKGVQNTKQLIFLDPILGKRSFAEEVLDIYGQFRDEKYFGCFFLNLPLLVVKDVDLVNRILVKDFIHFYDRGMIVDIETDPLKDNLFNLKGYLWRELRYKLTPTFTTGKLKGMFEQMAKCGENMVYKLDDLTKKVQDIEAKEFLFEFTTNVISNCAFGIQMGPESAEFKSFKSAVVKLFKPSLMQFVRMFTLMAFPKLGKLFGWTPNFGRDAIEYFLSLIRTTSNYRKENKIKRNDYLQLLLSIREREELGQLQQPSLEPDVTEDDAIIDQMKYAGQQDAPPLPPTRGIFMTDERVAANSVIFLVAGSESTSSTISFSLLELSRHPDVQAGVQNEVDHVLAEHQGQWSYQAVKEMVYLDQVIQEVLRLHPIFPILFREVTDHYEVPGSDLVLGKGSLVGIPVVALQRDPTLHSDPQLFKPDRFKGNNFKPNPGFLPFGDGPRICIAMRFAVLEVKTAVARVMSQYSVKLSPRTRQPLEMDDRAFIPSVKGGLWLNFTRRHENII